MINCNVIISMLNHHVPYMKDLPFFFINCCAGAAALWALAGSVRRQQQRIATMIGISTLIEMLMTSEKLQYIAGMALISIVTENIDNQNKIVQGDGIRPLVRLLRSRKTSQMVCVLLFQGSHFILLKLLENFLNTIPFFKGA